MTQVNKRRMSLFSFGTLTSIPKIFDKSDKKEDKKDYSDVELSHDPNEGAETGAGIGTGTGIGTGAGAGAGTGTSTSTGTGPKTRTSNSISAGTKNGEQSRKNSTVTGDSKPGDIPRPSFKTRAGTTSNLGDKTKRLSISTNNTTDGKNNQLNSPGSSPVLQNDLNIFERSVQDGCCDSQNLCQAGFQSPGGSISGGNSSSSRKQSVRLRSKSGQGSSISLSTQYEDYIPPALDATTSLLNDDKTNLDDVEMIYSSRRNSSVIGLNMALGRPSPSRKNSVYSMNQGMHSPSSSLAPGLPIVNNSNKENANPGVGAGNGVNAGTGNAAPVSPLSPPKLTSSRSSVSFYSYADMLNNDEYAKRPSLNNSSLSQGVIPTRKSSQASSIKNLSGGRNNKFNSNLNNFLISPESSDSEDEVKSGAGAKSVDEESLISSSVGDCLRQNTTEINQS